MPAGPPASSSVGTSGSVLSLCLAAIAISFRRPLCISGSAEPSVENAQPTSPPAIATYICDWSL